MDKKEIDQLAEIMSRVAAFVYPQRQTAIMRKDDGSFTVIIQPEGDEEVNNLISQISSWLVNVRKNRK